MTIGDKCTSNESVLIGQQQIGCPVKRCSVFSITCVPLIGLNPTLLNVESIAHIEYNEDIKTIFRHYEDKVMMSIPYDNGPTFLVKQQIFKSIFKHHVPVIYKKALGKFFDGLTLDMLRKKHDHDTIQRLFRPLHTD